MEKPGEGLLVRVYSYRAEIRGDAKGVINQVIITASLNGKRELSVGSSDSDLLKSDPSPANPALATQNHASGD